MADFALSEHERESLAYFRDRGQPVQARRAQIVLLSAEGLTAAQIVDAVQMSESYVYRMRRDWKKLRLGMFPTEPDGGSSVAEVTANVQISADGSTPTADEAAPRLPLELRETVGMLPDDAMAEAGRKVLHFQFERMLLHEAGSRLGDDIEAVHDMRVATRRMRSAFRLFKPYFKPRAIKLYNHGLRDLAALLGEVRDLDVLMENAQHYLESHPESNLDPLIAIWQKRLNKARRNLVRHLESKSFGKLVKRFHEFLITPGEGARSLPDPDEAVAFQVRHVAPRLIYELYERIRAYDPVLDGAPLSTLHALRIDFKRFRYALEFFEEILGPEIKQVIKECKAMQDHLGDLNDTQVAGTLLHDLIEQYQHDYSGVPVFMRPDMSGVIAYGLVVEDEQQRLLDKLPAAWAKFNRDEVRRNLALAVAAL